VPREHFRLRDKTVLGAEHFSKQAIHPLLK